MQYANPMHFLPRVAKMYRTTGHLVEGGKSSRPYSTPYQLSITSLSRARDTGLYQIMPGPTALTETHH